jgi:hypothetical protein
VAVFSSSVTSSAKPIAYVTMLCCSGITLSSIRSVLARYAATSASESLKSGGTFVIASVSPSKLAPNVML